MGKRVVIHHGVVIEGHDDFSGAVMIHSSKLIPETRKDRNHLYGGKYLVIPGIVQTPIGYFTVFTYATNFKEFKETVAQILTTITTLEPYKLEDVLNHVEYRMYSKTEKFGESKETRKEQWLEKYNEIAAEYIAESLHGMSVGEIIGDQFEGRMSDEELEQLMKDLLTDFLLWTVEVKDSRDNA